MRFGFVKKVCFVFVCLSYFAVSFACSEQPTDEPAHEKATKVESAQEPVERKDAAEPPEPVIFEKLKTPPKLSNGVSIRIVHITDGDTLYVVTGVGRKPSRIRLLGANAPECKKESVGRSLRECVADDDFYGLKSFQALELLVKKFGKKWKVECIDKAGLCTTDVFDRHLAALVSPNGKDLIEELIRMGAAWAYTSFSAPRMADYCRAEAEAIRKRVGMWKQGRMVVRIGMSAANKRWYDHKRSSKSHDGICSRLMGKSFTSLAGEK